MELARVLAGKPRQALFETKRLTRELIDLDTASALKQMGETFRKCINSEEHRERVREVYARLTKKSLIAELRVVPILTLRFCVIEWARLRVSGAAECSGVKPHNSICTFS